VTRAECLTEVQKKAEEQQRAKAFALFVNGSSCTFMLANL
jgi:hypothetical protein